MRKKIVAGNWKMNMNLQDGIALAKELNETLKADNSYIYNHSVDITYSNLQSESEVYPCENAGLLL